MSNFSIKKNDIMYIMIIFIILAIMYFLFYREGFENNYKNPYNLSLIRLKTVKNNNIVTCTNLDFKSMILLEKELDIPPLYLQKPDCKSCQIDEKNLPLRKERIANVKKITDLLLNSMNNLIYCNDNIVDSYKLCIKNLLIYISSNNTYLDTKQSMDEGLMYLNFYFLPYICQGYLLTFDIFNEEEEKTFKNYIQKLYDIIDNRMLSRKNNWKFGFGRCCFLCGIIIDNSKIYNQGLDILDYTLSTIDNDGFFTTEMDRGIKVALYNSKSACFLFDMIYFRNISLSKKISSIEENKISIIANNIINTYIYDNDTNNKTINIYEKKINVKQLPLKIDIIANFLNYDFVINNLNESNKNYIKNDTEIQKKYNPLEIGT